MVVAPRKDAGARKPGRMPSIGAPTSLMAAATSGRRRTASFASAAEVRGWRGLEWSAEGPPATEAV